MGKKKHEIGFFECFVYGRVQSYSWWARRICRGWVLEHEDIPIHLKGQQGGGGIMFWAGINGHELVGPFRVPDGVKMNSAIYSKFLDDNRTHGSIS